MGFHKVVYLYCNGEAENCEAEGNEAHEGDSSFEKISDYKSYMKKEMGWHFVREKAYCPICWQALKGLSNDMYKT